MASELNTLINKEKTRDPSPRRGVRLKSALDVQRLLARTINRLLRDEIGESKATKVAYMANILLKAIEVGELEQKVNKLEEKLNNAL